MSAPQYRIKNIEDFLAIPVDKRAHCLRDFAQWLSMADQKTEINEALIAMLDLPEGFDPLITNSFVWVDDGIEGISSIEIVAKETP